MEEEKLKELFKKYHEGTCTEEEKSLLEAWYLQFNEQELDITPKRIKAIGKSIYRELPCNHKAFLTIGLQLAIAAITIGLVLTLFLKYAIQRPSLYKKAEVHDISAGTDLAILTLSNGKKINLSKAATGQLALQSGIQIIKSSNGQLTYKITGTTDISDKIATNNISTPRGGQWQVILPDGTHVWLNAASSFDYPASFKNQKERIVQLSGEAYFEVAKDKTHPFLVKSGEQTITVLGTHFNVNAYSDEPSEKTTLAEGSVKVSSQNGNTKFLVPGQQAALNSGKILVSTANLEEVLAWKNGNFRFTDDSIQNIMRQLSRWYNIEVRYAYGVTKEGLRGKVSRMKNLSQVLNALEATKTVHFKVEGRRVTVLK